LGWSRATINIFLKIKSLQTEDDAVRLVGSGGCHLLLLKPGETVNAHRYHQQLIKLHRALNKKRPHYRKRHDKLIFLNDNAPSHVNNGPKLLGDTQLGSATSSRLLTRPGTFWLSPVFVDGPCARWAALRFLRRRPKMAWWVICLERWGIFLAWYTQIVRKMGKNV